MTKASGKQQDFPLFCFFRRHLDERVCFAKTSKILVGRSNVTGKGEDEQIR